MSFYNSYAKNVLSNFPIYDLQTPFSSYISYKLYHVFFTNFQVAEVPPVFPNPFFSPTAVFYKAIRSGSLMELSQTIEVGKNILTEMEVGDKDG